MVLSDKIPTGTCYQPGALENSLPQGATIEYSIDGGATWDYTLLSDYSHLPLVEEYTFDGTRTFPGTDWTLTSNELTQSGGQLIKTNTTSTWGDTIMEPLKTSSLFAKRVYEMSYTPDSTTQYIHLGVGKDAGNGVAYGVYFDGGGNIYARIADGDWAGNYSFGSYTAGTRYDIRIEPYATGGGKVWIKGGTFTEWTMRELAVGNSWA